MKIKKIFPLVLAAGLLSALQAQDIHQATRDGDLESVKGILVQHPDLLETPDKEGRTPLHLACFSANAALVQYLVEEGADVNAVTHAKLTTLHWAVHSYSDPQKKKEVVSYLLSQDSGLATQSNDKGLMPLTWAADDLEETIQLLVDHGADINDQDFNGYSALHAWTRWWPEDRSSYLIGMGANVNAGDKKGRMPLHTAALVGRRDRAEIFLEAGTDVNAKDITGATPLDLANHYHHPTVAELLEEHGGVKDIDESDSAKDFLRIKPGNEEATVWYLDSSSWAIITANTVLIFDFGNWGIVPEDQSLYNGRLNIEELKMLPQAHIIFFKTNTRRLDPKVREVLNQIERAVLLSATNVPDMDDEIVLSSETSMRIRGVTIHSHPANGGGLGLIIQADGINIYFGGNHGLWEGEPTEPFYAGLETVSTKTESVDIGFFLIANTRALYDTPRQGMVEAAKMLGVKTLFPMGASGTAKFWFHGVKELVQRENIMTQVICTENRGDRYYYKDGSIE